MTQARTQRIESEIQRVLAGLIAREVKDPRVGNVTITGVSVAADMGSAKIFFTPFASSSAHEQVQLGLTRAAGFLRGELGRRLGLRHAPRLQFVFDDSPTGLSSSRMPQVMEVVEVSAPADPRCRGCCPRAQPPRGRVPPHHRSGA